MSAFKLKSQLPIATQDKMDAIIAIPSGQRTATEAAFLTAIGDDYIYNAVISYDASGYILQASGHTVPTGDSGFAKGATFVKTDATGNGLYMNTGTTTTSAWDLVDQASTSNITDGAVTAVKLATDAVETSKIKDGNVTAAKLANSLVLSGKVVSINESTPVNAVASRGTLTVTGGGNQIADGDTVTLDVKTYTYKTALTPTEGEVLIGANDTAALLNLKNAINHTGTPDTDYKCAAAHPTVEGVSSDATTLVVAARTKGVAGDLIASTEVSAELSWDDVTLGTTVAGVDGTVGVKDQIEVDTSYLYVCIAANGISGTNWRRISLGTAY